MKKSLYINEGRISLKAVHKLKALKYSSRNLSSKHKKRIEQTIGSELQRVAVFDGNILFCIVDQEASIDNEKAVVQEFLTKIIREFEEDLVLPITLLQLPQSTVERLIFALLAAQAQSQGIYKLRGRTLFKPSTTKKKGHYAVETTLTTEDDWIKIYFVPTLTVLTGVDESKRSEMEDVPVIGLCRFRRDCELADATGNCKFFPIGHRGYFAEKNSSSQMPTVLKEKFTNYFKDCPQVGNCQEVISVKATKGAKNVNRYPDYAMQLHFADSDFANQKQKTSFRNSTLMLSAKRWDETVKWINRIFFGSQEEILEETSSIITQGGVALPIDFLINDEHLLGKTTPIYKPLYFPDQKIVINQQNPRAFSYGGGYQFGKYGAYDRNDSNRPFDKIEPFIIVPNDNRMVSQVRQLMTYFGDGYTAKQRAWGDRTFEGLNEADGRGKYNVEFVNPWDTEDILYVSDTSDAGYLQTVEDAVRHWNITDASNPNKFIFIVKPPENSPSNSQHLYYDLKSRLDGEGIPNQFITFDTLDKLTDPKVAFGPILQSLWLNIYAKMGGTPWRIENEIGNVHCFIGIGFGLNPASVGNHIYAGVAHIFDRYGNWVNFASDSRHISRGERQSIEASNYLEGTASFKISQETTEAIVYNALSLYKSKQNISGLPAQNIVLHKLGPVFESEVFGFLNAIKRINGNLDTCKLGILQIEQAHLRRLYGSIEVNNTNQKQFKKLNRTVLRGMALRINHSKLLVATTGRSHASYFGIGTPNPLLLTSVEPSPQLQKMYSCRAEQFYTVEILGRHVMALTQLHWGSTQDNVRQPITTLYAQKVAELISKMDTKIDTWTTIHRPWFL